MRQTATAEKDDDARGARVLPFPGFVHTQEEDEPVATRKDISELRKDIRDLKETLEKPSYFGKINESPGIDFSEAPVMRTKPVETPQAVLSARIKGRILVSVLSSFFGGGAIAIAAFLSASVYSRLLFLCLALPAVGTAAACLMAVAEGGKYDDSE